jgi:hypothetical protein
MEGVKRHARKYDPLRRKAEKEWQRLNGHVVIQNTYVKPPPGVRRKLRRMKTMLSGWMDAHRNLYERYVRRFRRKLPTEIVQDIRHWEIRICGFDAGDMSQFLWFFALAGESRMFLCRHSRACRRDEINCHSR